jgi:hypothetical protein
MWKVILLLMASGFVVGTRAAEIQFDWSKDMPGQCPPGFASLVAGPGRPADWKVFEELVPPTLAPLTPEASNRVAKRLVLAVQSPDAAGDHRPVLLFTNEVFYDFTLTTRFKIAGGGIDPEAGVVFRAQDQSNYYVVRASTDGNLLWYRVVGGKAYDMVGVGVRIAVPRDTWEELRVECAGSRTRCYLNGALVIPPAQAGAPTDLLAIDDTTFAHGRIGFWTRADTKCYFIDSSVKYTPKVPFVQTVVTEIDRKYPRLLGLQIYADRSPGSPVVIGAKDERDLGAAGTQFDQDVIDRASTYYLKLEGAVEVTIPLRDRNGEVVAALKTRMKSFPGETQKTAVARAVAVRKAIQDRIATLQDMLE